MNDMGQYHRGEMVPQVVIWVFICHKVQIFVSIFWLANGKFGCGGISWSWIALAVNWSGMTEMFSNNKFQIIMKPHKIPKWITFTFTDQQMRYECWNMVRLERVCNLFIFQLLFLLSDEILESSGSCLEALWMTQWSQCCSQPLASVLNH